MKMKYVKIAVFAFLMLAIMACSLFSYSPNQAGSGVQDLAKEAIAQRDELIRLYQVAQGEAANFHLTVDSKYGQIQAATLQCQAYYDSVVRSGEVWTGKFEKESQAMADLLDKYKEQVGSVPPDQLNLSTLESQGLLPDQLGSGFALFVNAVVQAPPPVPDSAVTLSCIATTNEGMETIRASGVYWNAAVTGYNAYRGKVSSEVVAAASDLLGYPLPGLLPYYQGGNNGPVTNPLATPQQ